MKTRLISILVLLLVWIIATGSASETCAQTVPDVTAGLTYHPLGAAALIWTPQKVVLHLNGTFTAQEVTAGGLPISGVQGIVYHPLGAAALIWTPNDVFLHLNGSFTATALTAGGAPIGGVRGIVYHPLGAAALIWTADNVYLHLNGTFTATALTTSGAAISGVQGITYHPLGAAALIWTAGDVYMHLNGTFTATALTAGGLPIGGVRGIVYHPLGAAALIWTAGNVFLHLNGTFAATALTASSAPIGGVQGVVYHPLGAAALIWSPSNVYLHLNGTFTATALTASGAAIGSVQGIAYHPLGAAALIWTASDVYLHLNGTLTATALTTGGLPIGGVRGIVYHPLGAAALIWTTGHVYLHLNGTFTAQEVMAAGAAIGGARGIVYHPLGAAALIWSPSDVYLHLNGTFTATALTSSDAVISDPQGVVYHPLGAAALIMTPAHVFLHLNGTFTASEVRENGITPISSYNPALVSRVQAVVHHDGGRRSADDHGIGLPQGGPSGAGLVGSPAITPVTFSGSSTAAAAVPSSNASAPHSTVVGAAPYINSSMILGPPPVSGVVAGNAMRVFAFLQGNCSYAITPTGQSFTAGGGTGYVNVTAGPGCPWTAKSNDSFITITSATSGTGNGTVTYSVAANDTGQSRKGMLSIAGLGFTVSQAPVTFADVPLNYWAWQHIEALYLSGITTGCALNPLRYCPESSVTRAQMAVFLVRAMHGSSFIPPQPKGVFADVPTTYWAAAWIEQLYWDGITTGCGTNPLRYCPESLVTRAQMAVFLERVRRGVSFVPPPATGIFVDVPTNYWAAAWIEQLYLDGITTGCASNPLRYCPESPVTRAQMAVFLVRTFNLTLP